MYKSLAQFPSAEYEERNLTTTGRLAETRQVVHNIGFDLVPRICYLAPRVLIALFVLARVGLSAFSLWSAVFLIVSYVGISSVGFSAAYVKFVAEFLGRKGAGSENYFTFSAVTGNPTAEGSWT